MKQLVGCGSDHMEAERTRQLEIQAGVKRAAPSRCRRRRASFQLGGDTTIAAGAPAAAQLQSLLEALLRTERHQASAAALSTDRYVA
jgi:hypothetical protein